MQNKQQQQQRKPRSRSSSRSPSRSPSPKKNHQPNNLTNDFQDTSASARHIITNARANSRILPSHPLQPYLSVAPVQTKFTILPVVDPRKNINVNLTQQGTYFPGKMFNPGNNSGPWSGFASSVNTESMLRNQIYALQKASQAVYVPSSHSDLYEHSFNTPKSLQPHDQLFDVFVPAQTHQVPLKDLMGDGLFNNSTRTMRDKK
jgi:hypothetical protein